MSQVEITTEITSTIELVPTEAIQHALGANHDARSGIAEIIDNSIDAGARNIAIVFQVDGFRLVQVAIHDDGIGMSEFKMEDVLRLGGHEANSRRNIGRYGMGMKEGSFANAETLTVVSKQLGAATTGFQLNKSNFLAGRLNERSLTQVWNLRNDIISLKNGTSIIWNHLNSTYEGNDEKEGLNFLSSTIESIRLRLGIRYHRFLENKSLSIKMFTRWDEDSPVANPDIQAINPFGFSRSGHKAYPKELTVRGDVNAPGVKAYIWPNRSDRAGFLLESKDELGHQGFYIYDADRLITQGGWSGFRKEKKEQKLLRIVIDNPRVINEYLTISPQKGSVRLSEDFHRFMGSLRDPENKDLGFDSVCQDAAEVLKKSNRKSGVADPLAEAGTGIAPRIRAAIEDNASLKKTEPVSVIWGSVHSGDFVKVNSKNNQIVINSEYRKLLNPGRGSLNDAPLVKTLLFLLFNEPATKKETGKMRANVELWTSILNAAVEEQLEFEQKFSKSN